MRPPSWLTFANVHWASLAILAAVIPWSTALISNAQLLLALNWIAWGIHDRDLLKRFRKVFTDRWALLFLSFWALHVLGLLWTKDLDWGLDLVRILLPLPILCIMLFGVPRLSLERLWWVLRAGAWSVVISTVVCLVVGWEALRAGDHRGLSLFVSHVRLGLLLVLAIAVFLWRRPNGARWWYAQVAGASWAFAYLFLSGNINSLLILGAVLFAWLWRGVSFLPPAGRWFVRVGSLFIPAGASVAVLNFLLAPNDMPPLDAGSLPYRSAGGEIYYHNTEDPQVENGHYVWIQVADDELARGWNARSSIRFNANDRKGQVLRGTLVRYLASKGLTKDSVGLLSLTDEDVERIENGLPSVMTGRRGMLMERLGQLRMELDRYRTLGDPNGHSLTMRFAYWQAGWSIAKDNLLVGVGTGDTVPAFARAYEASDSVLRPEWRHRAHNQFLTLLISFGVLGLLWSLFSWIAPAWHFKAFRSTIFVSWAIIFALSCLTEDTLETQVGATFFGFYYCLLVFAAPMAAGSGRVNPGLNGGAGPLPVGSGPG
ncbi:MAG: O-antigen ligase family protein [Flavobacteriales bacterium]|nr:O-antigen ligase family protein [Flavobacteriales bacterium]